MDDTFLSFFGVLSVYLLKSQVKLKKFNSFLYGFLFFFFLSPIIYSLVSIKQTNKRTDYSGKEIANLVERRWNKNFSNQIMYVVGDEWHAGNLSYHLKSRPVWEGIVQRDQLDELKDYMCLDNICVGSR